MEKIIITKYNPDWPSWFSQEATRLESILKDNCVKIHHIGSTSVSGLYAKPKIDIIAEVHSLSTTHTSLPKINYEYRGEYNIPLRHFFRKREQRDINLHVYEKDNPDIELNLLFRDFLLQSKYARTEYNKLKQSLLTNKECHKKNNSILSGYNLGKDDFIRRTLNKIGFDGFCFRFCTHYAEWNSFHLIAYKQVFEPRGITYNKIHSNFTDNDYYHFILNKGTKTAAIAELKWAKNLDPQIMYIASDSPYKNQNLEKHLKNLIYRWIKTCNWATTSQ
jgi:GrpB-like predicted nucleotidyltransferase (UPF0157 family)